MKMMLVTIIVIISMCHQCNGIVSVIANNNSTLLEADDVPAAFGPDIPGGYSLFGYLMYANPPDACKLIDKPPDIGIFWIALIVRNNCLFDEKVFNAQRAGYGAAIVYNNASDAIFEMQGNKYVSNITIPSVFIGFSSGRMLQQYHNRTDVHVVIEFEPGIRPIIYFVLMGAIGFLGVLAGACIVIINWSCNRAKRRKSLLSKRKLKKLPVHRFKTGDNYDTCAICLEEYADGDKLRLLPCAHAFHCKCIDPWLTEKKNTCPLCKDVVSRPRTASTSTAAAAAAEAINADETERLIDSDIDSEDAADDDDTVQTAGVTNSAFNTVAEVHALPAHRRNYGSLSATQSSLVSPLPPLVFSPPEEQGASVAAALDSLPGTGVSNLSSVHGVNSGNADGVDDSSSVSIVSSTSDLRRSDNLVV